MLQIVGVVGGAPSLISRNDDDFVDRLSHRYTTAILVVAALVVSTKQYVGDPINCWVPAHFTGNHEEYANSYCWVKNTYYLPFEEYIPHESETHLRYMIPYYQWIPIILLLSALVFYVPCMVWRTLNNRSGIDVNNIVEAAETFQNADLMDKKDATLMSMTKQMDRYLTSQQNIMSGFTFSVKNLCSRLFCMCCGRRHGNYLISLYLICKLLFLINAIGQLFVLNLFMGMDFHAYGLQVVSAIVRGDDWSVTSRFPRVTMCDLKIRRLGNIQRYTIQCVLPINLFNEAIFLFIWFWMVFVAFMTCFTLLSWTLKSAFSGDRVRFIQKHLSLLDRVAGDDQEDSASAIIRGKKETEKFVENYLQQDGVFIMRLIGHNTNAITVTEFICSLWDHYKIKLTTQ